MPELAPWQQAVWQRLRQRLEAGRLPHAILLCGPPGLGKRVLADHLVAAALCAAPQAGEACGGCKSCRLQAAGTHPDYLRVSLEENTQGNLRKEIVVAQIRAMSQRLAMTSQLGGRQIVIIDPADQLNRAAANALLKTLEEPARDTILVLLADQPWRLPATVRSRCQSFALRLPEADAALAWLRAAGCAEAEEALAAAAGNPGLARRWQASGQLALYRGVAEDLAAIAGAARSPLEVSHAWAEDDAAQRLWFAARLAADQLKQRAAGQSPAGGSQLSTEALLDWYRQAVQALEALRGPLRPALVLFPLLSAWR